MLVVNIQYEFTDPQTIDFGLRNEQIMAGTYTRKELIDLMEGKMQLPQFDKNLRINRTNKLAGITEMVFNLDELDNSNNLKDGTPSTLYLHIM